MGMSVEEAGRKGGLTTLSLRGHDFFSLIGKKGQKTLRLKYPDMASKWGKLGGRPKKPTLY